MNILYTFDVNKLSQLLLLQNPGKSFLINLEIYFSATLLLCVSLFYLIRPLTPRFGNPLTLLMLSVIQNPLIISN